MMARSPQCSSVLKDVVAYVDVWSSNKTENYATPFIDHLREMGAEVSKTLTKHVTHVVFKDGHQATWNKAKKIGAKLVSVLWVARCKDEAEFVDEELFPAQNDEGNCLLKKRTHRCMQPKDSAEKTPENDRRMKRKLDKMIKDLAPQLPLFPDVSPYIIDEENGIVYSPSLKRSDSMAKRLKEMREKRENLSPTASQMVEDASSSSGVKPHFGFSPTILKLLDDKSDEEEEEESSSSLSHPHHSPKRGDTGTHHTAEKPWLSPCSDVPKRKSLIHFKKLNSGDGPPEEVHLHTKSRRSSMKNELLQKQSGSKVPCQDPIAELPENPKTKKLRQSKLKFNSSAVDKSAFYQGHLPDDVKQKTKPVTSSKTHTMMSPGDLNPPSCLSSPAVSQNTQVNQELAKGVIFQLKKADPSTPKNKRRASLSALARKSTLPSESLSIAPSLPEAEEEDGDVFEDYFSPANHNPIQKRPSISSLPVESRIQLPFELASVSGKRKRRRSETSAPNKKKSKQSEMQSSENSSDHQCSDAPITHPHIPDPVPSVMVGPSDGLTHPAQAKMNTDDFETQAVKHRIPYNPKKPPQLGLIRGSSSCGQQKQTEGNVRSHAMESGGSQQTVAAGGAEPTSEDETSLMKMEQSKATRTLVTTSMSTEKQQTVTQVVKLLGGFSIVDCVCETTTHVVSGGYRRTLNVLLGIARGCWILSFEWMLWSLEQRRWLPEEPYELSDHFPAAPICRLQQHLSAGEHQQDLFRGQPAMFVSPRSQPPAHSLVELIQLCGGTVCKLVRQAGLCIGNYNGRRPEGSKILSEQWVLDCITQLKLLSYENYNLE